MAFPGATIAAWALGLPSKSMVRISMTSAPRLMNRVLPRTPACSPSPSTLWASAHARRGVDPGLQDDLDRAARRERRTALVARQVQGAGQRARGVAHRGPRASEGGDEVGLRDDAADVRDIRG